MQEACEHGDENYIIQNHTELIADYCSILDGLSKYVTVGEEKNPVQKLSAAIDNFDQAEAMKLLEVIKNETGSSMADSDAQLIADMEAQIELFDFISAAETLKNGEVRTMSKLSDRIIQVLIRKDVSIHAQLFRFMSLLGTIAMAVGGVYTLAEGMEIKNVAALFAGALFMGMLFWAGNKFQQYDLCSFILMSGLNGIFLPVTFLRSGGLKSGMPLWFVLGFISLFFPAAGKSLAAGTVITIIADAYCFYTAYVHPERITYMESESVVYGDIIVSAVITIFLTCAFMFIQITLSEYQRKENEKQQAELVAAMNTQSRFLANMSHEIRTPINTIIGLNEMTLREENLSDDIIENANNIQSAK